MEKWKGQAQKETATGGYMEVKTERGLRQREQTFDQDKEMTGREREQETEREMEWTGVKAINLQAWCCCRVCVRVCVVGRWMETQLYPGARPARSVVNLTTPVLSTNQDGWPAVLANHALRWLGHTPEANGHMQL